MKFLHCTLCLLFLSGSLAHGQNRSDRRPAALSHAIAFAGFAPLNTDLVVANADGRIAYVSGGPEGGVEFVTGRDARYRLVRLAVSGRLPPPGPHRFLPAA